MRYCPRIRTLTTTYDQHLAEWVIQQTQYECNQATQIHWLCSLFFFYSFAASIMLKNSCLIFWPSSSQESWFSYGWKGACVLNCCSRVQLFGSLWAVACQAPLSMGFSRQEYWSGLSRPPPEDLPNPGIKLMCLKVPAFAGVFFTTSTTWVNKKKEDRLANYDLLAVSQMKSLLTKSPQARMPLWGMQIPNSYFWLRT